MGSCKKLPRVGGPVTPKWSRKQQPDVHIIGWTPPNGTRAWYMTATGNLLMASGDLCTWFGQRYNLFPRMDGVDDRWAPQIADIRGRLILTFTARNASACPSGVKVHTCRTVYWAELAALPPLGLPPPFWQPTYLTHILTPFLPPADCPRGIAETLPQSYVPGSMVSPTRLMGLDSHLWSDSGPGGTGETWVAWSANSAVPRPKDNIEVQSLGIARIDPSTMEVACEAGNLIYPVADVQQWERAGSSMRSYCEFMHAESCRFWPDFTAKATAGGGLRARYVFEAPALIRRGRWVYLFFSASMWTSPNYGVYFLAAPSVKELTDGSRTRIAGQFVVPFTEPSGRRHNFGHGAPVVAPDGAYYFVFHHMVASDGIKSARRAFMAPMKFVDKGDGRGEVWIEPIMPLVPQR